MKKEWENFEKSVKRTKSKLVDDNSTNEPDVAAS